jgi:hypothetical protein
MRIDGQHPGAQPSNPYHIARAYGVRPPAAASQIAPVSAASGTGRIEPTAEQTRPDTVRRLVAGIVPGGVDFAGPEAAPRAAEALPMYRHPADRNAAATAVNVGRRLDVSG